MGPVRVGHHRERLVVGDEFVDEGFERISISFFNGMSNSRLGAEFPFPTLNLPPYPWWNCTPGRAAMSIAAKTAPEDPTGERNPAAPTKRR